MNINKLNHIKLENIDFDYEMLFLSCNYNGVYSEVVGNNLKSMVKNLIKEFKLKGIITNATTRKKFICSCCDNNYPLNVFRLYKDAPIENRIYVGNLLDVFERTSSKEK